VGVAAGSRVVLCPETDCWLRPVPVMMGFSAELEDVRGKIVAALWFFDDGCSGWAMVSCLIFSFLRWLSSVC
jgi:hypothetical protein